MNTTHSYRLTPISITADSSKVRCPSCVMLINTYNQPHIVVPAPHSEIVLMP